MIRGMEKGQAKTPKKRTKTILTDQRISKRLAVETTSSLSSQPLTPAGKGLVHFA